MACLLKGEIRWVAIEPASQVVGHEQGNNRPALILSNNRFNDFTDLVVVALITSTPQVAGNLYSLEIHSVNMPRPSWVLVSQMRTLSARRIGELIGTVDNEELNRVHTAILRLLVVP
ncbi:MAG: type II toxin-antitoxin system PemK/MazF family toxin [Chloroflexota bacterium]|nr:type II toxin-antitoxin system PemK/MazF family toxin [Chloroflexota bacterium]